MVWPAAGAGPAKLALAVQDLCFTRLAPSRRDGAADILTTPTAIHRRPMFSGIWQRGQREEMSATFLDVRGRPCALFGVLVGVGEPGEPEKKRARGRSCLALDLLRHGLGGYVFSRV